LSNERTSNGDRTKRVVLGVIGLTLSAAGLWWVFRKIDVDELLASADRVRVLPLVGSAALYWCGLVVLRTQLVRHLLRPVGRLGFAQTYRYICIGFLANNVLPFRAGDVARAAAIHRGTGIRFPSVVGSLALERLLDMVMVAALGLAAIQVAPALPRSIRLVALIGGGGMAVAFVLLIFVARRAWREAPPGSGGRLRIWIWNLWVRFSAGFSALGTARGVLAAAALAVGIWILALGTMALRLAAFDLPPTWPVAVVLLTCLGFGVAVPSAPGFIGVYHAAAVFALELFDVDREVAVAFGIFSWLVDIGLGCVAGAISLSIEGLGLGDLRRKPPDQSTASPALKA
jgi:uncharacterized membrane protein YbhN (UPF0104 family)